MNIAESMKHVLKNKSQNILTLLVREDLKNILKNFAVDVVDSSKKSKKQFKNFSFRESYTDLKDSAIGSMLLIKAIPQRLNNGFKIFSSDLVSELEKLPDQKQKTIFCMKVLAGMSKFAISSAYDVGLGDAKLLGITRHRNLVKNIIVSKLVYTTVKSLIVRMIEEMEKEVTEPEELKQLQSFKHIVIDDSGNAIDKFFEGVTDPNDRAFAIVDKLKKYIQTGE